MDGQKSNQNISTSSKSAVTTTTALSHVIHPKRRFVQNFLLIWVDANIDESKQDYQHTLAQLRSVVNDVYIFTQPDESIDFLTEADDTKAFLILEGTIGQHILPLIHDIVQLDSIYIFCGDESPHKQWVKEWPKITDVYTNIKPICEALKLTVKQCNQDDIALSFFSVGEEASNVNLNKLEPSFMYTQIFKEILLEMEHNEKSIKDLATYCRQFYDGNRTQLAVLDEFEHNYRSTLSIWWYTRECFTYKMLNQALRTLDGDTIINMGFFIRDLHQQIQELYQRQVGTYRGKSFKVYRGQRLSKMDFEKLVKTKGGLMSFNNFLSTSQSRDVSLIFAEGVLASTDMVGILFEISIDPSVSSAPFASIGGVSYFQEEEEILFSMHTVFRIGEITKIDKKNSLYQVNLKLTADDDQELRTLTERIRKEVVGETGWQRLGQLLVTLSQLEKAEELYNVLLEQTSDPSEKATDYNNLGYIKDHQGDYEKAIEYHEKALEIEQKTLPENHPSLATSYNNIGSVYDNMGEYSKALSYYEKALEIRQKTLPENHHDLATSYNNIGLVYNNMGEYSKALSYYEKALEIRQKTLPENHHSLAISYNNIGLVYRNMGEYPKAVSYYKKDLEIQQKTLPENHPSLAISYNNIGLVYRNMGEYPKAVSYYKKDLEIQQKTLPENHPRLATSYNNIGGVYNNMGEYSKALSYYEKALEIQQKTLPANHPHLANSYNNISSVYKNMVQYPKALSYHEKALKIYQKTLPENHPSLATSYNNIAMTYYNMGEYSKSLSYFERAQNILQSSLPPNHPHAQSVRESIRIVKGKL
jgi:tetratricopeptide (TPR) repeat protein